MEKSDAQEESAAVVQLPATPMRLDGLGFKLSLKPASQPVSGSTQNQVRDLISHPKSRTRLSQRACFLFDLVLRTKH